MSVASSAMEARSTNKAAKQQYANNEAIHKSNVEALQAREVENNQDAATNQAALARESSQVRASQLVANAESGGGGNTAIALLRDIGFNTGLQQVGITSQLQRQSDQTQRELTGNTLNTNINNASVKTVSKGAQGLKIAGIGLSAAAKGGMFGGGGGGSTGSLTKIKTDVGVFP